MVVMFATTPLYFSPVWEGRRQCAILDDYLRRDMLLGHKVNVADAIPVPEEPPKPEPVIIQVSGKNAKKKPEGQLMFEL